jgi:hypothetical protein
MGETMQLTANMLRQLVDLPADAPQTIAGAEKRRSPRLRTDLQATLLPFSERIGSDNFVVSIRDISRGGVSFVHASRLPLGEQFALVLPDVEESQPVVILCTIAYWQPLTSGEFAIGARFCRVLRSSGAGLSLLLEDAVSGAITETRRAS